MSQRDSGALTKQLGLWGVFSIATGAMISSGLFVLPGLAFARIGPAVVLAYALAGLLNVPTLLAQSELVTAMPRSAGSYFFVERSLGAYMGTVAGLISWCSIGLKAAFALVGIGTLAVLLLPSGGYDPWIIKGVAIGACLFFTVINLVSVEGSGRLQGILVVGLLLILGVYVMLGSSHISASRFEPFLDGTKTDFMAVIGMIFISYGGISKAVGVAEEVRKPKRNLPWGMALSFIVVNILYVTVVSVTVGILPKEVLSGSLQPITEGATVFMGSAGLIVVTVAALLAYATTGNAGILAASRAPMAMSRDGLVPGFLSRTHPRFKTPHLSILLTSGLMVLIISLLSLEQLVKTASTMLLISLALTNLSVIVMRHSRIEGYRPTFRMPLCPWLPLGTVILYGFLIAEMGMVPLLTTAAFIAVASIWYVVYVQHKIDREAAVTYLVKSILSRHIQRTGLEDELVQISLERDEVEGDRFDHLVRAAPILDIPDPITMDGLFEKVSQVMSEATGLEPERLHELLVTREREASTIIQPGLAIPHVVVPGENIFQLALVRCKAGAAISDLHEPIHMAFVLMGSPDQRNFHLRALVAIARVVQEPGFQQRWTAATNAEQLRDIVLLSSRDRTA